MPISDTDGSATMTFTERTRRQTAQAPHGSGFGPNTPQPTVPDMVWTNDADC